MLDKMQATFGKLFGEIKTIRADVSRLKLQPVPKDGKKGDDGISPLLADIVTEVLASIPTPKDGEDGKDAENPDVDAVAFKVLSQMQKPKNGKNGVSPAMADIVNEVLAKIPTPKDGKSADVAAVVDAVLAQMPAPDVIAAVNTEPMAKPVNGKDGASITKVKLEKGNKLAVWIDGKRRVVGTITMPKDSSPFIPGGGGGGRSARSDALSLKTDYKPGDLVKANTAVYDAGWLMASLIDTTQRAAVQPTGDPFFLYSGTPTDTGVLAKQVILGQRYTFNDQGGYIKKYKLNTVTGNHYDIYTVKDPLGVAELTLLQSFTAGSTGDQVFGITPVIVPKGTSVDVLAVIQEPDPTPTIFTGDWRYTTPTNQAAPSDGQAIHPDKNLGVLNISKVDNLGADRSTELEALTSGDKLIRGDLTWSLQSVSDEGSYMALGVAPALQSQPDGVQELTFETTIATPISYQREDGYWVGNDNIQGLFIVDGPYTNIIPDNNAYGILDLEVQAAEVPTDWFFMALSGDLSSGGGGGGGAVTSVNGKDGVVVLTPDDMDDAETRHKFSKIPIRVQDSTVAGTGGVFQLDITNDMVVVNVFSVTQDIIIRLPDQTGEVDYMCHIYNQTGSDNNVILQHFDETVLQIIPPVNAYQPYFDITQGVTDWTIIHTQGTPIPILSADEYGNLNALAYDGLLVERFYMTDLGSKFLNTDFTFLGGSTYTLLVTTINKPGVYYQEIEIISTDSDFGNTGLSRPSRRAGLDFSSAAAVGWKTVALRSDAAIFAAQSGTPIFQWSTDTTATNPTTGYIKGDNADLSLVTEIYISENIQSGVSIEQALTSLTVGDLVFASDFNNIGSYLGAKLTGDAVDNGGWYTLPVAVNNSGTPIPNDDEVALSILPYADKREKTVVLKSLGLSETNADYDDDPQIKIDEDFTTDYARAKITFSSEALCDATNRSVVVALFVNDVQVEGVFESEPKDTDNRLWPSKVYDYDFATVGSQNIKVYFGRHGGGGGAMVGIESTRVFVERLND